MDGMSDAGWSLLGIVILTVFVVPGSLIIVLLLAIFRKYILIPRIYLKILGFSLITTMAITLLGILLDYAPLDTNQTARLDIVIQGLFLIELIAIAVSLLTFLAIIIGSMVIYSRNKRS